MKKKAAIVTGASGGIGAALAAAYAAPGVMLHLGGLDARRLEAVADRCRSLGASVATRRQDVADKNGMADWVAGADAESDGLDLVIANAGIYLPADEVGEATAADIRREFEINALGVLNTVLPAIEAMRRRRHGHLALMSSLSSFRGMGLMPAYCASKAAVRVWGEGLRDQLAPHNVRVTIICPGHVATPICNMRGRGVLTPDHAARLIRAGIDANRPRIAFPTLLYAYLLLSSALPPNIIELVRRLKRRRGDRHETRAGADGLA